ncbi:MAG: glycosyltransferase [Oscillospiraceae bacterium]|nr:glycosyltransferase [Oscillospiraceae bacterium]
MIISVYANENPGYFTECVQSILTQSVLPDEWIIVKDGPLTSGLEDVIRGIAFPNKLRVIALPENVTQGPARAEGVKAAQCDWVAIMDSDDICMPDRFEKQLTMIGGAAAATALMGAGVQGVKKIAGVREAAVVAKRAAEVVASGEAGAVAPGMSLGAAPDLIGGQIAEFFEDPKALATARRVPLGHGDIAKYAKYRNPFNCMTVMMRRSLALEAGNFRYFPYFEDYDLWARMIKAGAICANHPDPLVNVRVGSGMYARRRGAAYVRSELRMQQQLRELGFNSSVGYLRNVALRVPPRLLPARGVAAIYKQFIHKNNK